MPAGSATDILEDARQAFASHRWDEAREGFAAAELKALTPMDLEMAADAQWWAGYPDEAFDTLERAFLAHVEGGDRGRASFVAVKLAYFAHRRNAIAVGRGWLAKAESLLDDQPESPPHAWVALMKAAYGLFAGFEADRVRDRLEEAIELAERHGVPSVRALAMGFKGFNMVNRGEWREGLALIDESTAAAMSGEVEDREACDVYCNTIAACTTLSDYRRAGEWTEEAERWMQRNSLGGYPGICKVHRAQVKKLRGDFAGAMQQARSACEELERYRVVDAVSLAFYEIGEIRLRMGDLDAAEEAFARSYENGWHAQPGLALALLARGETVDAFDSIEAVARIASRDEASLSIKLHQAELLSAYVKIAIANDELGAADKAASLLERIADTFEQDALVARSLAARGALQLARNDPIGADGSLGESWRLFNRIDMPYETAQARVLLAEAKEANGDERSARMERQAARTIFKRLGATLDLARLSTDEDTPMDAGRRVSKAMMFTDMVTSTDLAGVLGDSAWDDVLRWHDKAVREEFTRFGGQEVRHTGDGFFVVFDRASDAVDAAVAIQRRLAKHRKEHGFSPHVRIGLHQTEATYEGGDFSGYGVHVASRIESAADQDEILASEALIGAASAIRYPLGEVRSVSLKGVADPAHVQSIDWR